MGKPLLKRIVRSVSVYSTSPLRHTFPLLAHCCGFQRASQSCHRSLCISVRTVDNCQSSPNAPKPPKPRDIPISPVTGVRTVAIDCEMVETKQSKHSLTSDLDTALSNKEGNPAPDCDTNVGQDGEEAPSETTSNPPRQRLVSLVGRCSIVDYNGRTLFDKYIDPRKTFNSSYIITNYRTEYSGITEKHMKRAVPFNKARQQVLDIVKDSILIGHNINNDLRALRISRCHGNFCIRDTGTHKLLKKMAGLDDKHLQTSLKKLTKALLDRDIQMSKGKRRGHCSLEDARATMDLYKLVEQDWNEEGCSASDESNSDKVH